jgi:D-alanyl-D-alanine carboxypeptidase
MSVDRISWQIRLTDTRIRVVRTATAAVLVVVASITARADRTDDYIKAEMQRQGIPGLALAVIDDGKTIKAQGYGVADVKLKTPVTAETVFKIGSVSKQFIATGIMVLVQAGQIGLDDPVGKYIQGAPESWRGITIRHLLTHTSGLVREAPGFEPFKVKSDADVIKSAFGTPLRAAPGEKYQYSNLGYFILAEIIHVVSRQPWTDFLTEKVFAPSEMRTTYPTNTKQPIPNRAIGYADNTRYRPAKEWTALRPSGAFLSTVLDLAKWDGVLATDRVLNDASRKAMWTPVTLNSGRTHPYGFGWELNAWEGHPQVHHGGALLGFLAELACFLDRRLTVIVLINLEDADVESIAHGVAGIHLDVPVPAVARRPLTGRPFAAALPLH